MSSHQAAQRFVRDQLRIMKKYGNAPKLSATELKTFVASVQRTFDSLRPTKQAASVIARRASVR
jgi:hypothetical protein